MYIKSRKYFLYLLLIVYISSLPIFLLNRDIYFSILDNEISYLIHIVGGWLLTVVFSFYMILHINKYIYAFSSNKIYFISGIIDFIVTVVCLASGIIVFFYYTSQDSVSYLIHTYSSILLIATSIIHMYKFMLGKKK